MNSTVTTPDGPLLHRLLEHPLMFAVNQLINPWTVGAYADFVRRKVLHDAQTRILDVGCGLGAHYPLLSSCRYTGIDINPRYVAHASRRYGGDFQVMDASALNFCAHRFDAVVSVATCHHLSDQTIAAMIGESMRVLTPGGLLHIVDPILPLDSGERFKRFLFESDRGRFQRTRAGMQTLLSSQARLVDEDLYRGPMHDVCYFALTRP